MLRFAGKVAIVTGAANGIGKATAKLFAKQGAAICAVDLPNSGLNDSVREIEEAGGNVMAYEADVTKNAEVEGYVRATVENYGGVDILFNNAGIEGVFSPLELYPVDNFDKVLDVNLKAPWLALKHVTSELRKRGGGAIVNNASTAGLTGLAGSVAYCASKSGLIGITRTAAIELAASNIRVNAICAGLTKTRLAQAFVENSGEEIIKKHMEEQVPLRRMGRVEEVANLVAFLASEEASYITGCAYPIDGGYLAQ